MTQKADRSTTDLDVTGGAVRHIGNLRGNGIRQPQPVGKDDAVLHDLYAVSPDDGFHGGIYIRRRIGFQDWAVTRLVVEAMRNATQITAFHQS